MYVDKRLLRLARRHWPLLLASVGMGGLSMLFAIWQASVLSQGISLVFLEGRGLDEVRYVLTLLLFASLLRALTIWGSEAFAHSLAVRVKQGMRQELFQALEARGPLYLRGERLGEVTHLMQQGVESLHAYFGQYLPALFLAGLAPLIVLVAVFPVDFISALVMLLTAPLIPFFMALIGAQARLLTQKRWRSLSAMSAYLLDVLRGLPTLKLLGRSAEQTTQIARVSERFRQTTMQVLRVTFLSALVLEMVATLSTAIIAVGIGLRLLYGEMPFQAAFFVLLLAPEFYQPLRSLGARFHAGMPAVEAAQRIYEVLEAPAYGMIGASHEVEAPRLSEELTFAREIEFRQVSFRYPESERGVSNLNLVIPAGSKVAIVGPNGAGKSTLAALLLGFIRPQGGQVLVDGKPLENVPLPVWWKKVGWVSQNPFLLNDSVLNNLLLARPEATLEEVIQAAEEAQAHKFVLSLPQGYYTQIGERGARLSAGQAQRLVLARAFLKKAPLLVLDEPSAFLDVEHEEAIANTVYRLMEGRTVVVIAHRAQTIRQADYVVVMDRGEVVAQGSHEQIIRQSPQYRRLLGIEAWRIRAVPAMQPEWIQEKPISLVKSFRLPAEAGSWETLAPHIEGKRSLEALVRLVRLMLAFTPWMALSVVLGFATIAGGIGLMSASAWIISAAALHPSIAELQVAIVGVRFFGITRGLFRYLERLVSHQVTFRVLARLRVWFYQALQPLVPARLAAYRGGDLLQRILGDIERLEGFYVRALAPPWVALLVGLGVWVFLIQFDLNLAWVYLGFYALSGAIATALARLSGRALARNEVGQRAELSAALVENLRGLEYLLVYPGGAERLQRIHSLNRALEQSQLRLGLLTSMQAALNQFLAYFGSWLGLCLAIPLVAAQRLDGVFLAVVLMAILTSFEGLHPIPLAMQHMEGDAQSAARLFEVVSDAPPPPPAQSLLPPPTSFSYLVSDLSFHYPPEPAAQAQKAKPPLVLQGVSFTLPHGGRIALVGPSGAGKSTLLYLMLGLWEVQEGSILLNGKPIQEYSPEALRQAVGVVSQHTYIFGASIRENLLIAHPQASEREIIEAAQLARLHGFILSLPQGYDTWVGEEGLRLSGGERQRLALARALLKNPALLIFDEPTANLDPLVERQVMHTIVETMKGRTVLMATHRLVGMEHMDQIIVLDKGKVVALGSHEELLSQHDGLYRRMWELQQGILFEG